MIRAALRVVASTGALCAAATALAANVPSYADVRAAYVSSETLLVDRRGAREIVQQGAKQ